MDIKKIQILGPFSTGTNLLSQILINNLEQNVIIHPEGHTLFWKHTINRRFIINSIKSNATCKIDFTPFCCASSIAF